MSPGKLDGTRMEGQKLRVRPHIAEGDSQCVDMARLPQPSNRQFPVLGLPVHGGHVVVCCHHVIVQLDVHRRKTLQTKSVSDVIGQSHR